MSQLFIDNDVLIKAAHWSLLDEIPEFVGMPWHQISAGASLIYRAKANDCKLFRSESIAQCLASRLQLMSELPPPDETVTTLLQGEIDLDVGEVALIGALCSQPTALMLTGDKRALRALSRAHLDGIHARVRGRVLCLEQLLEFIANKQGCQALVDKIEPHRQLDAAVRCIIGTSSPVDDQSECNGLLRA